MQDERLLQRARIHAALGDPHRLAIVDELRLSDRAPSELRTLLGIDSNLLAHHLDVLEELGLIERVRSQGDRRRRYVRLIPRVLMDLDSGADLLLSIRQVIFVCTENIARSQLASALWNALEPAVPASSAGTDPKDRVHPKAVEAAARRGLNLHNARPKPLPDLGPSDLLITVCDRAYEALRAQGTSAHLHWSVPDPVTAPDTDAFDAVADLLSRRIRALEPLARPA
ncbi:MAG TPA: helix-turn-helix domain-containing protein [Acidimicrobiales bacterium]|nr:helix-turn-helix domain-containing protein [Acidimicrobiales bacterium]